MAYWKFNRNLYENQCQTEDQEGVFVLNTNNLKHNIDLFRQTFEQQVCRGANGWIVPVIHVL